MSAETAETAYESMRAAAETPDGRVRATILGADQVEVWIEPGYLERASAGELEGQLARLARLLMVERTRAYYRARSRDFSEPMTKEPAPRTAQDREYVERRGELVVEGGHDGTVLLTTMGLTHWSASIDREWLSRCDAGSFCSEVAAAASALIREQLVLSRRLKLEIFA